MEAFFIYILKVAVLTAAFGILYHYLLKKETFHRFNRMVLAASLLLAYILPFFVISVSWSGRKLAEDEYQKYQNGSAARRSHLRLITPLPVFRARPIRLRQPLPKS